MGDCVPGCMLSTQDGACAGRPVIAHRAPAQCLNAQHPVVQRALADGKAAIEALDYDATLAVVERLRADLMALLAHPTDVE